MDYQTSNLPLGLAMANILDEDVRNSSRPLTEAEKEKMIFRYKDAECKAEKERIRNDVLPDDDVKNIFSGPGIG